MNVLVVDAKNYIEDLTCHHNVTCVQNFSELGAYNASDFDVLVICDKLSIDILKIEEFIESNIWKIYIFNDVKSTYPIQALREKVFVELFFDNKVLEVLKAPADSTQLIKRNVMVNSEANNNISENDNLQNAVDSVFGARELVMNSDDSEEGLKINLPKASGDLDLGDMDNLSIELHSEDDEVVQSIPTQEDTGLDLDNLDSGLSLSEDGDSVENSNMGLDSGNDLDLDQVQETSSINENEALGDLDGDLDLGPLDDLGEIDDLDSLDDLDGDLDLGSLDDLGELDDLDTLDESGSEDLSQSLDSEDEDEDEDEVEQEDRTQVTTISELKSEIGVSSFNNTLANMLRQNIPQNQDNIEEELETVDLEDEQNLEYSTHDTIEENPVVAENINASISTQSASDLLDLKMTLTELKGDRRNLVDKISKLEDENERLAHSNLNLKADLDELRIEISILNKRHLGEIESTRSENSKLAQKNEIVETKLKAYQREIERLGNKVRVDYNKVHNREKELESQLELLSMDADSQVKSRDLKILELKRKIDALEFNMENISIREKQSLTDKNFLENKLNKVVGTLRNSLSFLEQEVDIDELKKDLDIN